MGKRRPIPVRSAAFGLALALFAGAARATDEPSGQPPSQRAQSAAAPSVSPVLSQLTPRKRLEWYAQNTFAPFAFVGPVIGAALTQWTTGNPEPWGQGFRGYGRRLSSGYARQVIANTITLGVGSLDGEDPRHCPSLRHRILPRSLDAVRQTFVARTASGRRIPAFSRFAGVYAAALVANAWYPSRNADATDALYRGSTALASNMVYQLFQEFWPDAKRALRCRREHKTAQKTATSLQ